MTINRLGYLAGLAAFASTLAYDIVQILQIAGVLQFLAQYASTGVLEVRDFEEYGFIYLVYGQVEAISLPLTDETRGLLGSDFFAIEFASPPYFINVGRGAKGIIWFSYDHKPAEKYPDTRDEMQRFYDLLPYLTYSKHFVACHAAPPISTVSKDDLINIKQKPTCSTVISTCFTYHPNGC